MVETRKKEVIKGVNEMKVKTIKAVLAYVSMLIMSFAFGVMFAALVSGAKDIGDVVKMLIGG